MTHSTHGSGEKATVWFQDQDTSPNSGIGILFSPAGPMYSLVNCMQHFKLFPTGFTIPKFKYKWWEIEKRGLKITVSCNGQEVLRVELSTEVCDHPDHTSTWKQLWKRHVTMIKFPALHDTGTQIFFTGRYIGKLKERASLFE